MFAELLDKIENIYSIYIYSKWNIHKTKKLNLVKKTSSSGNFAFYESFATLYTLPENPVDLT